jgi:YbgC/YbaW family acyl-CoA thioester hydrolase
MGIFPFSVDLVVRGYEMDLWGHVNNAVYLQWLEHARWEMARAGDMTERFEGLMPVVRSLQLDYDVETKLGDSLRVTVWPRKVGNTSLTLGAAIRITRSPDAHRQGRVAMKATMVLTCVRAGEGKVPVPSRVRELFPAEDPGAEPPAA